MSPTPPPRFMKCPEISTSIPDVEGTSFPPPCSLGPLTVTFQRAIIGKVVWLKNSANHSVCVCVHSLNKKNYIYIWKQWKKTQWTHWFQLLPLKMFCLDPNYIHNLYYSLSWKTEDALIFKVFQLLRILKTTKQSDLFPNPLDPNPRIQYD